MSISPLMIASTRRRSFGAPDPAETPLPTLDTGAPGDLPGEPGRASPLPTAVAMLALVGVYASWQLFRWTGSIDRQLVGDVFFFPVVLAAIAAAWSASRRCAGWRRLRVAWRLVALASVAFLLGNTLQTWFEVWAGSDRYAAVQDLFYLAFSPLMLAGLLWFPAAKRSRSDWTRFVLDLAVATIGGSAVVVWVIMGPGLVDTAGWLDGTIAVAYPVGDMVMLVGAASVLLQRPLLSARASLAWLAGGLLVFVAGDTAYAYAAAHSGYQGGDAIDVFWMVAIACLAVAGAAQRRVTEPEPLTVLSGDERVNWLPYLAVALGFGILLGSEADQRVFPDVSLTGIAVALAVLVAVRQYLSQRDLLGAQQALRHQALHDALTGLPNRALVLDRAEQMSARAARQRSTPSALYVDIDGFKHVNDTFGHSTGDAVLRAVASRLSRIVREADTVGRLGGDEFVVLLDSATLTVGPELVAERILEVLRQPIDLGAAERRPLSITVSIGVAAGAREKAEELIRDADIALYQAKEAGRDRYVVFRSAMQAPAVDYLTLEMDLRDALAAEQFFLLYQPTFDLRSETLSGVEALLRWDHPERGVIEPELFIPMAENSGLIVPIGRWVIGEACRQAAQWHRAGHPIGMAVNISARQLEHDLLLADVREALDASGLPAEALTLEITETALMRNTEDASRRVADLKTLGIRIAIDDFGTGYSSLAYLRQFPVDALKIDRSFISGIAGSKESGALVHTLVQLGKILGLQTLGEGIEEHAQLQHLRREDCDLGQGFLLARPVDPETVERLLADRPVDASWVVSVNGKP